MVGEGAGARGSLTSDDPRFCGSAVDVATARPSVTFERSSQMASNWSCVRENQAPMVISVPLMITSGPLARFRSAKVAWSNTVSS
jgi:hypothetical protein